MHRQKMSDYSQWILYLALGVGTLLLRYVGENFEPFSLALLYAAGSVGLSPWFSGAGYFLSSLLNADLTGTCVALMQTLFLSGAFAWQNYKYKTEQKRSPFLPFFCPIKEIFL